MKPMMQWKSSAMSDNIETESTETESTETESTETENTEAEMTESENTESVNSGAVNPEQIKNIIEAALMAAGQPLSIDRMLTLFMDEYQPTRDEIRGALEALAEDCADRGVELKEVSSGFRFQSRQEYAQWVARLWEEKPARYSRALLETLSLIAYRQPITRGEIEDIRGVSVSSNIMKTLQERDWVKVVGHRDVPGKPAMYATTRQFLDYFSLKSLSELPTLAEIRDIDTINAELDLSAPGEQAQAANDTEAEAAQTEMDTSEALGGDETSAVATIPEEQAADTESVSEASSEQEAAAEQMTGEEGIDTAAEQAEPPTGDDEALAAPVEDSEQDVTPAADSA
jgi:segregation and condensation protein B